MERYLTNLIRKDLDKKLVLLSGPRQAGKTYLARKLITDDLEYLNFDSAEDRTKIVRKEWRRDRELVVFDELHKMRGWKRWLKGLYDTEGVKPRILVTGSARMDVYRKGGDSLAGRHFSYRLHPLSVKEAASVCSPEEATERLLRIGGFPEPFLDGSETFAARWRRSHLDRILREDLLDLERVTDLRSLDYLVDRVAASVGSPISYASLSRDVGVSPQTIKKWLHILEALYVVFLVTPYTRKLKRAILKEPKIYLYDIGRVHDSPAARLENAVACALLKRANYLEDTRGERVGLHYLRDKDKKEVDFLVDRQGKVEMLVEVKTAPQPNHLAYFGDVYPAASRTLVVREGRHAADREDYQIRGAAEWLGGLEC